VRQWRFAQKKRLLALGRIWRLGQRADGFNLERRAANFLVAFAPSGQSSAKYCFS